MIDPTQSHIGDHSPQAVINDRTGLFIAVVSLIVAAAALGLGIAAMLLTDNARDRATISENHWRNLEVEQKALSAELERLKEDRRK